MEKKALLDDFVSVIEEHQGETIGDTNRDLVEAGIIDSYTVLLLITHVQKKYQVEIDLEQLNYDLFRSLNNFVDLVAENA